MASSPSRTTLRWFRRRLQRLNENLETALRDLSEQNSGERLYIVDWSEIQAYASPAEDDLAQFDAFVTTAGPEEESLQQSALERLFRTSVTLLPPHALEMDHFVHSRRRQMLTSIHDTFRRISILRGSEDFQRAQRIALDEAPDAESLTWAVEWIENAATPLLAAQSASSLLPPLQRIREALDRKWLVPIDSAPFLLEVEVPSRNDSLRWYEQIWDHRQRRSRDREEARAPQDQTRSDRAWRDANAMAMFRELHRDAPQIVFVTRSGSILQAVRDLRLTWTSSHAPVRHVRAVALLQACERTPGLAEEARQLKVYVTSLLHDNPESFSWNSDAELDDTPDAKALVDQVRESWRKMMGLAEVSQGRRMSTPNEKNSVGPVSPAPKDRRDILEVLRLLYEHKQIDASIERRISTLVNEISYDAGRLALGNAVAAQDEWEEIEVTFEHGPGAGQGATALIRNTSQGVPYEIQLSTVEAKRVIEPFEPGRRFRYSDFAARVSEFPRDIGSRDIVGYELFLAAAYVFASSGRWKKAYAFAQNAMRMNRKRDDILEVVEATLLLSVCERKTWKIEKLDHAYYFLIGTLSEQQSQGIPVDPRVAREIAANRLVYIQIHPEKSDNQSYRDEAFYWLDLAELGARDNPRLLRWVYDSQLYAYVEGTEDITEIEEARSAFEKLKTIQEQIDESHDEHPAAITDTLVWAEFRLNPDSNLVVLHDLLRKAMQDRAIQRTEREEMRGHLRAIEESMRGDPH